MLHRILLDSKPSDSGGMPAPVQLPVLDRSKPEQPSTPPAEVLAMTFDAPDELISGEDKPIITEDKETVVPEVKPAKPEVKIEPKTEVKKVEEKKDPIKSILKPPAAKKEGEVTDKTIPAKPPITPKGVPKPRDYTGYTPEQVTALKGMSNEAFEFSTKLLKENGELAKSKDSLYLQHPEAYRLDPQYKSLQTDAHYANKEALYWQQQLALCKAGKNIRSITGWDDKGNPVVGEELAPTDILEEQIRQRMNSAFTVNQQLQGKVGEFSKNYQQRITSDLTAYEQARKERFAWVADPTLLDHTVAVEGMGDLPVRKIREDMINVFPPQDRSHPAVQVCADLMVALQIGAATLREAQSGQQTAELKQEELQRGEPKSTSKPAKTPDSVNGVVNFDIGGLPED